jgi:Tfp pilus assembly protein PilF
MFFPIGDSSDSADLASGFGVLLYTIGEYARALEYFQHSLVLVGVDHRTMFNIALCLNRLERPSEAAEWIERTLELNPNNEQAQEMRVALADAGVESQSDNDVRSS